MKKFLLLFCLLFSFGLIFAQTKDSLSVEEQEKRKRNIEAGNPFKKFGYTPKIATLSKGKYLEWHDLDSIVRIGSYSFHVKKKDITGYNMDEDKNSESTLRPELTSRWLSPDPLAEEFPSWSPYNFVMNNPIFFTDPTGLAPMSPIYGTDGSFLGTDDEGLQGKAIVMDKSEFKQNMSHKEALTKNKGVQGLNSTEAVGKLLNHYNGLKNRPDYDGIVSLSEANDWARNGNGQPLFVDVGKLDLSSVSVWGNFAEYDSSTRSIFSMERLTEENYKWKSSIYVNFLSPAGTPGDFSSSNHPGLVFGTLGLTLLDRKTGEVRLGNSNGRLDVYDFETQKGRQFRNTLTWIGRQVATQGGTSPIQSYSFFGYGKAYINKGF